MCIRDSRGLRAPPRRRNPRPGPDPRPRRAARESPQSPQRHGPRLLWVTRHGDTGRTDGCGADGLTRAAGAPVGDLDHGRSTTLMDGVGYAGEAGDVFVAPDTELVDVHATGEGHVGVLHHDDTWPSGGVPGVVVDERVGDEAVLVRLVVGHGRHDDPVAQSDTVNGKGGT